MKYQFYIGIDTGVETGFCIWNAKDKFIRYLDTLAIHKAMEEVKLWHQYWPGQVFVRFEDARQRKWIPRQKNEKAERGRREGAGSVKRDAKIWEDFLTELKVPFEMVAPMNNKTKLTAASFLKITGIKERCSVHARDAAMLVIGY
jgi:hypothetical protein